MSKPLINKLNLDSESNLSVSGIADYFGPTSNVILYVIIKTHDGKILAMDPVVSDKKGEFGLKTKFPNHHTANNYTLEIMSQYREEHQSFCTNSSTSIPISVSNFKNSAKVNDGNPDLKNITNRIFESVDSSANCENASPTICKKENPFFIGTRNDDVIAGTPKDDTISGMGGNDVICGVSGNDLMFKGMGNDTIYGGTGNDGIDGSYGNDLMFGGTGDDSVKENNGIHFCIQVEQAYSCYN